jgi:hypothetical protein
MYNSYVYLTSFLCVRRAEPMSFPRFNPLIDDRETNLVQNSPLF